MAIAMCKMFEQSGAYVHLRMYAVMVIREKGSLFLGMRKNPVIFKWLSVKGY